MFTEKTKMKIMDYTWLGCLIFLQLVAICALFSLLYGLHIWSDSKKNKRTDSTLQMLLSYFVLHTSFMLSKSINKRKRKKESQWTEQAVAAIAQGNIDEIRENERFIHSYNNLKQDG